ncbi:MAG: hypothetical protein WCJ81_06670 [bacterium]
MRVRNQKHHRRRNTKAQRDSITYFSFQPSMNTLPHSEQALNSLFRSTTNQSAFLQAKKEIAQVISSYSQLDVAIPKRTNGKNKDIIINDTISIKDFCKKLF